MGCGGVLRWIACWPYYWSRLGLGPNLNSSGTVVDTISWRSVETQAVVIQAGSQLVKGEVGREWR